MPSAFAKRNLFGKKEFTRLQSQEMGALCPFYTKEVYPGDTLSHSDDAICRLAAMLYPVYDFVDLFFYYFYVPYRIIWDEFETFIVGYDWKKKQSVEPVLPYISLDNASSNGDIGTLKDYFGFPVQQTLSGPVNVSALKYRAYAQICNDWFINEFLQDPLPLSTASGADTTTNTELFFKNWPRDYFTSGLPFAQVGDPITLPVASDSASVKIFGTGNGLFLTNGTDTFNWTTTGNANTPLPSKNDNTQPLGSANSGNQSFSKIGVIGLPTNPDIDNGLTGLADLTKAFATSVADVRTAFQLQRIQERLAREGVRFVEYIAGSFGVRPPDARLQRAEYLGGGRSPILVSEVLQTGASQENSPQGNVSGHGFGAMRTPKFTKSFTEHGIVIGLVCVMPRATYSQGLHRHDFANRTRYDFLQPELAHLGEQPVYNKEIYLTGNPAEDDKEFAYQPRYEDFRRDVSTVAGDFRTTMAAWYFGRTFASAPALNSTFITAKPSKLPFAAGNQADRPCWLEILSKESIVRALPKKGVPGLIDH